MQVGDELQCIGGVHSVTDFEVVDVSESPIQLYSLFISGTQNFSITKHGFYVHNVVPLVLIAGGIAAKTTTAILLEKAAEVAVVGGIGLGAAYLHSKHQARMREKRNPPSTAGGGGQPPEPPDGPWWKKVFKSSKGSECPNGIYKDAPYHGKYDGLRKSHRPTDGQHALDNSFELPKSVNSTSTRRLAISYDEFVVLDQTRAGEFHGHVRDWKNLTDDMQRELLRRKLVNNSGRIRR